MKKSIGKKLLPVALACALFCTVGVTACKKAGDGTDGEHNGSTGGDPAGHEHVYAYAYDADNHWQVCAECGDKKGSATHTLKDGVCTTCGYHTVSAGLTFELSEGGESYTLTGIGTCEDVVVGVPEEYEGKPVTKISAAAFGHNETITTVALPSTLTEIESMAFFDCAALEAVALPDSLTVMGGQVFGECSSLKRVTVGKGLTEIPMHTFYECSELSSVVFSAESQLQAIGLSAFAGCVSLAELKLPAAVLSFGESAFAGCAALRAVSFGAGAESIGAGCFDGCTSLTAVTFAETGAWHVSKDIVFVEATEIPAANLSETAAKLLTQTYVEYYWQRGELPDLPDPPDGPEDPPSEEPPLDNPPDVPPEEPPQTGDGGGGTAEEEQARLEEEWKRLEEEKKQLEEEKKRLEEEWKRLEEERKRLEEEKKQLEESGGVEDDDGGAQDGGN